MNLWLMVDGFFFGGGTRVACYALGGIFVSSLNGEGRERGDVGEAMARGRFGGTGVACGGLVWYLIAQSGNMRIKT